MSALASAMVVSQTVGDAPRLAVSDLVSISVSVLTTGGIDGASYAAAGVDGAQTPSFVADTSGYTSPSATADNATLVNAPSRCCVVCVGRPPPGAIPVTLYGRCPST